MKARRRQLPRHLIHGRGADAAAHDGEFFVSFGQAFHIKAVAHGAGQLVNILIPNMAKKQEDLRLSR